MKKVNIIGEQAWHVFMDKNGNEVKEECTLEEYDSLNSLVPNNPTKANHTWKFSYKDWEYDTISGRLEEDNYAIESSGIIVHKPIGKPQVAYKDQAIFSERSKNGDSL